MKSVLPISLLALLAACAAETKTVTHTKTITRDHTSTVTNTVTVPGEVACEDDLCVVSGTITEDTTFTADKQWLLRGGVFIGDDTTETVLTVEPGTTVYGESSTGGMLVIRRHARIVADGTAAAPIVFTSSKPPGSRAAGDWGGLVVNGLAPLNACGDETGPCEQFGEGGTGFFGGDDPEDDSGVLRYVRVEFAGRLISPDNELNGVGLQGVGSGTVVDFVQVHRNADDGIEFFGGTADFRHVYVTGVGDDLLDWTDGWTGRGQYFVGQQWPDTGDNGIEADNNGEDNDAAPRSSPLLANLTLVGSPGSASSDFGALLREGTAGRIFSAVITGFDEACLSMAHGATLAQANAGALAISASLVDCDVDFLTDDDAGEVDDADIAAFFSAGAGNLAAPADLGAPFDPARPDLRPAPGSAALTGGAVPEDPFFDPVPYRGGIDPAADWTAGWTTAEPN